MYAMTHLWWNPDRTPEIDPYADDQAVLEANRERILGIADIVIPGHGGRSASATEGDAADARNPYRRGRPAGDQPTRSRTDRRPTMSTFSHRAPSIGRRAGRRPDPDPRRLFRRRFRRIRRAALRPTGLTDGGHPRRPARARRRTHDGQVVTVTGTLIAYDAEAELCDIVMESYPPQCGPRRSASSGPS